MINYSKMNWMRMNEKLKQNELNEKGTKNS